MGRVVIGGLTGTAARLTGWAGAIYTIGDVVVPPFVEFGARNASTPGMDPRWLEHEFTSQFLPQMEALTKSFTDAKCDKILAQ